MLAAWRNQVSASEGTPTRKKLVKPRRRYRRRFPARDRFQLPGVLVPAGDEAHVSFLLRLCCYSVLILTISSVRLGITHSRRATMLARHAVRCVPGGSH